MAFFPNGVKYLKRFGGALGSGNDDLRSRHSFANITEALRNHTYGAPRRDSSALGLRHPRSYSPGRGSTSGRNAYFESITAAVVQLFQKRRLQEGEVHALQDNVRHLVETDAGPLIYDYYKEKILKKGMVILRESIKNESGSSLLQKLGDQWDYFYKDILPFLQALLFPIRTKDMSIRDVTLLGFRNVVLLKLPFSDALNSTTDTPVTPNIEQMLLVLQSVKETPCTENYVKLEKLVARVVSPYLGLLGLYLGSDEPAIRSNMKQPPKIFVIAKYLFTETIKPLCLTCPSLESPDSSPTEAGEPSALDWKSRRHRLSPLVLPSRGSHSKLGNGLFNNHLSTVKEQDAIRRHSIDTT